MEFLVEIEINLPADLSEEEASDLRSRELAHGKELRRVGHILRIWRIPGRRANVGVWSATDATELHEVLTSLPMFPWLDVRVQPLSGHPIEAT
jgi:muconolactone D-isomerase